MIYAGLEELQLELFLRMRSQIVWKTRNGECIPIDKMSDTHLINTINMIKRMEDYDEVVIDELRGLDLSDIC